MRMHTQKYPLNFLLITFSFFFPPESVSVPSFLFSPRLMYVYIFSYFFSNSTFVVSFWVKALHNSCCDFFSRSLFPTYIWTVFLSHFLFTSCSCLREEHGGCALDTLLLFQYLAFFSVSTCMLPSRLEKGLEIRVGVSSWVYIHYVYFFKVRYTSHCNTIHHAKNFLWLAFILALPFS